jgi:hypothetical protein
MPKHSGTELPFPSPDTVLETLEITRHIIIRRGTEAVGQPKQPTTFRILRTNQRDEYETKPMTDAAVRAAPLVLAAKGDEFQGSDRKKAKLSVVSGATQSFDDITKLIKGLAAEKAMVTHKPPLTRDPDCDRVHEEKRNVRVRAWVYAASRENDNDFHLIVGRAPAQTERVFMTMEVSGLPPKSASSFAAIKKARDAFAAAVQLLPGPGYDFYPDPIPVEIGGSLFFDFTHVTGGRPGPKDLRPDMPVIWEVHPVTHFVVGP